MPEKNPFDDLLDQIAQLLQFVQEHSHIPPDEMKIPPGVDKKLDKLTKRVEAFKRLSEDIVALSGVSREEIKKRLAGVSNEVPDDGKELISKAGIIKREVESLYDRFEEMLPVDTDPFAAHAKQPKKRKLTEQEQAKKRRGKFKRFGSSDTWKPL